ncbi:Oxysterol-binding protein-related protein 2A [Acorus gramineus]|uniref:Oxysterol-binding protein-related protein 2A n=1 Tax=Acorus gramineus TaxID=55184 RepID=A0AAV9AC64_ACOGR|nr:Oxysterol-binding protein-related protein 2A [Acorus gramineus]
MHPLCCISIDCPGGLGDRSRPSDFADPLAPCAAADPEAAAAAALAVAGVLYKWTNYGRGWRPRWFSLKDGVLSYSKIRQSGPLLLEAAGGDDFRLIGDASPRLARLGRGGREAEQVKAIGVVHLKISSFRESKSDDRRFYIFSATKTLHLRTDSKKDRTLWIEALVTARSLFTLRPLNDRTPFVQNDVLYSTEKLRDRLLEEGLGEPLIKECEKIMVSEFSELNRQLKLIYEDRFNWLGALGQLEEDNVEAEGSGIREGGLKLMKDELSSPGNGKFSEYSTTESSDDIEKQELDDMSDEDEPLYFDTSECFIDSAATHGCVEEVACHADKGSDIQNHFNSTEMTDFEKGFTDFKFPCIERRKKLPDPIEKEKGVSLWSMIKDNVGKDLTRVCLPVYFNEPISSLQKCFEELEYSYLLDRAYEYGKMGNSLMRILNVAAFAVSGYASSDGRHCKPFNPMLGETYEADYPEQGIRFFSEKVSHHPMLIACHCEGRGWKFSGDSNLKSKFWGRSIQLDPVGVLTLEFDDGEIFQWSKVTTTIYNLILGKLYCDHHGIMHIQGNHQYSCKLKFKEQSILDRNPHQVHGSVEDGTGNRVATFIGKWDDSVYYVNGDVGSKYKNSDQFPDATLLWKRSKPPSNPTRYNLTSFAIMLNELTSELQEKLPPTDSRLRPDQRHLENGEYEKANAEKLRLEKRQRMSRKLQEDGWRPRWFRRDSESGTYRYIGGYWEAREQKRWDGCPNIFGDVSEDP